MGKNFAYCNNCEKEILKPKRRAIDTMYYNVWILTIISSLGIALIPFLIYRYIILKKNYCPNCKKKLDFYNSKKEFPEPKVQIARILQTIEQEQKEKEEYIICPYCQEKVLTHKKVCPICGSTMKE